MNLGNFLRWGGSKPGEAAAAAESGARPRSRSDRRSSPRVVVDGRATLYWTVGDAVESQPVELLDVSADGAGVGLRCGRAVSAGSCAWMLAENEPAAPLTIMYCELLDEGFQLGASATSEKRALPGVGSARLCWTDSRRRLTSAPATIRNAEEGRLEALADIEIAPRSLVLIEGREAGALAVHLGARRSPDGLVHQLEVLAEIDARSTDRAA